jgi:hypothetical protein
MANMLNSRNPSSSFYAPVDVASWESQLIAFQKAEKELGYIDVVYPIAGIGERRALPEGAGAQIKGYVRPNLEVCLDMLLL